MAVPTRPVQGAIIDPVWGQWVHDAVAGASMGTTYIHFGELGVAAPSTWKGAAVGTLRAAPAGIFHLTAFVKMAMVNSSWLTVYAGAEAVGAGGEYVGSGLPGATTAITYPFQRFYTHTGGDLLLSIGWGFGGGDVDCQGGSLVAQYVSTDPTAVPGAVLGLKPAPDDERPEINPQED